MYEIIKSVIQSKDFKLSEILKKIDTLWVENDLTDEQRTELVELAKQNVLPESETPETIELYKQILAKYEALDKRVTNLENGGIAPEPPVGVVVPSWEPWDGISDRYKYGAVVTIDQNITYPLLTVKTLGCREVWALRGFEKKSARKMLRRLLWGQKQRNR